MFELHYISRSADWVDGHVARQDNLPCEPPYVDKNGFEVSPKEWRNGWEALDWKLRNV